MAEKIHVSAKALVKDIKDGLTDEQLAAKYDLSLAQLVLRSSSKSAIHLVMEVFHGQEVGYL